MTRNLALMRLRPALNDDFAPFGRLVEMGRPTFAVNEGTANRYDVDALREADVPRGFHLVTSIYDADPRVLPLALRILERHIHSPQLIMPVDDSHHAVIVCASTLDGRPDLETLIALRCSPRQGVIYRPGVWHHPITALERRTQFLVQSWQNGSKADCEIVSISASGITVEAAA